MQESASFLGSWGDFERTSFLARLQEDLSYSLRELLTQLTVDSRLLIFTKSPLAKSNDRKEFVSKDGGEAMLGWQRL